MDNQQMGEIRKALKEAHEHGLDADPTPWPGNANLQYWVGDHYDGIGAFVKYEDAYLAAHAPTWLRSLIEENDQLRQQRDQVMQDWKESMDTSESLIQTVERITKENREWREQLLDALSELAVKDKALKDISIMRGQNTSYWVKETHVARRTLEQHARSAIVPNE